MFGLFFVECNYQNLVAIGHPGDDGHFQRDSGSCLAQVSSRPAVGGGLFFWCPCGKPNAFCHKDLGIDPTPSRSSPVPLSEVYVDITMKAAKDTVGSGVFLLTLCNRNPCLDRLRHSNRDQ